jgi:hypothetical protein
MKTLQILVLTFLLTSIGGLCSAKSSVAYSVRTSNDFKKVVTKMVEDDFARPNNYLNECGITKLDEEVKVIFTIDSKNQIRIIKSDGKSGEACTYVKQLLNYKPVDVSEEFVGKRYSISIALRYLAF